MLFGPRWLQAESQNETQNENQNETQQEGGNIHEKLKEINDNTNNFDSDDIDLSKVKKAINSKNLISNGITKLKEKGN